ncbi:MAG TPA: aminoglycoside phosphotransferase family protein [Thermomicrobiales bacterium]|nr:aminoglycoside phosphotransferase family protein [Thermomicrobiales bacterium]
MREPPAGLTDATLRARLRASYGRDAAELTFLPLGRDSSARVYRARTADGGDYFLKVRRGAVNEAGLAVPRSLHERGIARVVAPLPTGAGALWTEAGDYALILYPYVAGATGRERAMTPQQWIEYGALLRRVHDAAVTADLARVMRRETFAPDGADMIRRLDAHLAALAGDDPIEGELARFWRARRAEIRALLDRAVDLGRRLARAAPPLVLCHADIHTANVLVADDGRVWFVDWDETVLAPRERDLMFVAGGISSEWVGPNDEARFFQGYGDSAVDPLALAYYRHAWAVSDLAAFGDEICSRPDLGPATRRAALDAFTALFRPGEIVALAFASPTRK